MPEESDDTTDLVDTHLRSVAKLIRSKNAGPFLLTFDVFFDNLAAFRTVRDSGILSANLFSTLYGTAVDDVKIFEDADLLAIKVSIPRPTPCGDPNDTDVFGCQLHGPLVDLPVPKPH